MSDATETASQQTTTEPDLSPAAFANADDGDTGAPALDPNAGQGEEEVEEQAQPEGEEGQPEAEDDDPPPEFWSAEKKAVWAKITDPEARAAIREHYNETIKSTNKKIEEAALKSKEAEARAAAAHQAQEQSVAWWTQAGPQIQQMLQGKWSHFTPEYREQLANENPAESVKQEAAFRRDQEQWNALRAKQQQEMAEVESRQKARLQSERAAHHATLAAKYPKEFGGEKAQETYNTLSKYAVESLGVPAERIPNIYESFVVETLFKAYKFDRLQAKAKEVTNPKPGQQNAAKTPTRVAPGAANRTANPSSEAKRQALQALRTGERMTPEQLAEAFA